MDPRPPFIFTCIMFDSFFLGVVIQLKKKRKKKDQMKNLDCNQIKIIINLEIIGEEENNKKKKKIISNFFLKNLKTFLQLYLVNCL